MAIGDCNAEFVQLENTYDLFSDVKANHDSLIFVLIYMKMLLRNF